MKNRLSLAIAAVLACLATVLGVHRWKAAAATHAFNESADAVAEGDLLEFSALVQPELPWIEVHVDLIHSQDQHKLDWAKRTLTKLENQLAQQDSIQQWQLNRQLRVSQFIVERFPNLEAQCAQHVEVSRTKHRQFYLSELAAAEPGDLTAFEKSADVRKELSQASASTATAFEQAEEQWLARTTEALANELKNLPPNDYVKLRDVRSRRETLQASLGKQHLLEIEKLEHAWGEQSADALASEVAERALETVGDYQATQDSIRQLCSLFSGLTERCLPIQTSNELRLNRWLAAKIEATPPADYVAFQAYCDLCNEVMRTEIGGGDELGGAERAWARESAKMLQEELASAEAGDFSAYLASRKDRELLNMVFGEEVSAELSASEIAWRDKTESALVDKLSMLEVSDFDQFDSLTKQRSTFANTFGAEATAKILEAENRWRQQTLEAYLATTLADYATNPEGFTEELAKFEAEFQPTGNLELSTFAEAKKQICASYLQLRKSEVRDLIAQEEYDQAVELSLLLQNKLKPLTADRALLAELQGLVESCQFLSKLAKLSQDESP